MSIDYVKSLISAAGADRSSVEEAVFKIGPALCADVVVGEIASRFESPLKDPAEAVFVNMVLTSGDVRESRILRATSRGMERYTEEGQEVDAEISQDLCELVHILFGFTDAAEAATRKIELRDVGKLASFKKPPLHFYVVQRLLDAVDRRGSVGLAELAGRYGADKWGIHLYTEHYERHFSRFRDRQLTVLEIGIGGFGDPTAGGSSLRMWRHYFPRAVVYGIDIHDKTAHDEVRIKTVCGDQSDAQFLGDLADRIGPIDIIVDDGSHISGHVLASFRALFPRLRPGGIYSIEDLQTSYWPRFGGASAETNNPSTSMGYLKSLVDGLNHEEFLVDSTRGSQPFDGEIKAMHFYHNLAIVEKGLNREGGGPDWARYGLDSAAPR